MADQRTYQGHVYQQAAPGQPWVLVGPAQSAGPQPVTIGTPDPSRTTKSGADATKAVADAQTATAQAPYAGTTAAAQAKEAVANAAAAEAKASAAVKEQANAPDPEAAKIQRDLQTDSVIDRITRARQQIDGGWATGNIAGTQGFQHLPVVGQNSMNLAATLSGLTGSIINDTIAQLKAQSANGSSGYGALSETEATRIAAAVAALQQTQDKPSLLASLADLEKHYRGARALLNNEDPRDPKVAAKYGIGALITTDATGGGGARSAGAGGNGNGSQAAGADPNSPAGGGGLTADGKFVPDPAMAGANAKVREMVLGGASADQVRQYLERLRPGLGSQVPDLENSIAAIRQNPQRGLNVDVEKNWVPNSGFTRTMGNVGMGNSVLGGVGPALIGAADTASMGTLDNIVGLTGGNADMTRAAESGISAAHPTAYTLGELLGGASTGLGLEAGAGKLGLAGIRAARAGDFAYGSLYNAGSADDPGDSRLTSGVVGGLEALFGGAAGRKVAGVTGRALSGVKDSAVRALDAAGIRMTPGQILGGRLKNIEDRLSGLPLVGDTIRARRGEGVQDFNVAAFDQGLAPIGASTGGTTGAPGIEIARALRSGAYDNALDPVTVHADAPFGADMQQVIRAGDALPEPMRSNMQYTLPTRVNNGFGPNGELTGKNYQQVLRGLRRDTNAVSNLPYGHDFGQVARGAEDALGGLVERQSPGTVDALATANEVNRNVETLRAAVNAARNGARSHQVEQFMPSQLSDAAAASAKKFGNSHGTTNQPFYELTRAGQKVLPSTIPDSGTAGRWLIPAVVAGGVGGGSYASQDGEAADRAPGTLGTAALAAAVASAPYSSVSRKIIQRALLSDRPDVVEKTGQFLIDNARIAGLLASPGTLIARQ